MHAGRENAVLGNNGASNKSRKHRTGKRQTMQVAEVEMKD